MKAVISVYKSDAVEYLKNKGISREDAIIIMTKEDFEAAKGKVDDVHLISAPLGVSGNEEDLKDLLFMDANERIFFETLNFGTFTINN